MTEQDNSLATNESSIINLNGTIYTVITSPVDQIGYYEGEGENRIQLTNFILVISKQISIKNKTSLFLDFTLFLNTGESINLSDTVEDFFRQSVLRKSVVNAAGIKVTATDRIWKSLPSLVQEHCRASIEYIEVDLQEPEPLPIDPRFEHADLVQSAVHEDLYIVNAPDDIFGYWDLLPEPNQISHFIVELEEQIRVPNGDTITLTYFSGKVIFAGNKVHRFDKLDIDILSSPRKLKTFITNLCGYKAIIQEVKWEILYRVILSFHRDILDTVIKSFGYNNKRTEYITENLIIAKDSITEIRNPMSYEELFGTNKLTFTTKSKDEIKTLKKNIRERLLEDWDSPEVMMTSLAFTMLPIIYPYLKDIAPNKFFFMLQGPSGAGKSLIAKWMQRFYGKFDNLLSWTSTESAINYAGNIMKDALIVVDDFKKENFSTATDIKNAMRTFQNYSDGTGRLRANGLSKISKEKVIQGFLMLSAEDVVITQTSTLARGIVVEVDSKETKTEEVAYLNELSKNFSAITADYIQYVMNDLEEDVIKGYYELGRKMFELQGEHYELSYDNQARMIQNFALLYSSWGCFRQYLCESKSSHWQKLDKLFAETVWVLFLKNFKFVNDKTSYLKFTTALWELAESNPDTFVSVDTWNEKKTGTIGCYELIKDSNGEVKSVIIVIKLNEAYKKVNAYLSFQGGIGTSPETLEQQLRSKGLIPETSCGVVAIPNKKSVRGEKWIGDYPKDLFVEE